MRYEEVAGKENEGLREFRCNELYLCLNVSANLLAGGAGIAYSLLWSQWNINRHLFLTGVRNFYLFRNIQTGTGAHAASF
jgi:hypothetical protein